MYLRPAADLGAYRPRVRRHLLELDFLSALGVEAASTSAVEKLTASGPSVAPKPVGPIGRTISPPSTTTTTTDSDGNPEQGMCVVTSSPGTGGVTSVVPCANVGPNTGGTIQPVDSAVPSTPATPVPSNYPESEPYYASDGSVWTWNSVTDEWQEEQGPGSVDTSAVSPGYSYYTPPVGTPPGYPTNLVGIATIPAGTVYNGSKISGQGLEDTNGNIWDYYNGAWTVVANVNGPTYSPYGSAGETGYTGVTASPVPADYPTTETYYDSANGTTWSYDSTTGTWVESGGTGYVGSAISPVPVGYPTTETYYDSENGTVWNYNATSGQWMETSATSSYQEPGSSPVPSGYPITQPYYASDGSVWNYSPTTGTWVETELPGTAAAAAATESAVPGGGYYGESAAPSSSPSVNVTAPSGGGSGASDYQSVIDWFSQESIISGVKNIWVIGVGILAYTWLKNRKR